MTSYNFTNTFLEIKYINSSKIKEYNKTINDIENIIHSIYANFIDNLNNEELNEILIFAICKGNNNFYNL